MCGRFALKAPPADIAAHFGLDAMPEAAPRYNIAPTQDILIVRHRWQQPEAGLEAVHVKWGLLPSWAKDASMAANPRPEIVGAIRKFNNKVHVVCTQLSIHCAKTIAEGVGTGCSKVFSAGSQKNACCAGSVVFDLNTLDFSHGIKEAHINFVMKYVATPLCMG